jgi:hypothetical protein
VVKKKKEKEVGRGNPNTWEAEAGRLSSRPVWASYRDPVLKKKKKPIPKQKKNGKRITPNLSSYKSNINIWSYISFPGTLLCMYIK